MIKMHCTRNIFFLLILLFVGLGCEEDEPYIISCKNGPISWELVKYGPYRLQNVGDKPNYLPNVKLTIQTQADFEYYLKPVRGIYPTIDFERKTMLIVRTGEKLAFQAVQKATMDCDQELITLQIDALRPDGLSQFPELPSNEFALIIPKITKSTDFQFQANILE